tara:strand:- start:3251 stop:3964 length:714 start_codon:yes stop_codon:yes gene_type:complete
MRDFYIFVNDARIDGDFLYFSIAYAISPNSKLNSPIGSWKLAFDWVSGGLDSIDGLKIVELTNPNSYFSNYETNFYNFDVSNATEEEDVNYWLTTTNSSVGSVIGGRLVEMDMSKFDEMTSDILVEVKAEIINHSVVNDFTFKITNSNFCCEAFDSDMLRYKTGYKNPKCFQECSSEIFRSYHVATCGDGSYCDELGDECGDGTYCMSGRPFNNWYFIPTTLKNGVLDLSSFYNLFE